MPLTKRDEQVWLTKSDPTAFEAWDLYTGQSFQANNAERGITDLSSSRDGTASQFLIQTTASGDGGQPYQWRSNLVGRVIGRLRALKKLGVGRGGLAAPADPKSVDYAIQFVGRAELPAKPYATLDDEGCAVIEMEGDDGDYFIDITFLDDDTVELYRRESNGQSEHFEGAMDSPQVEQFLRNKLGVFV